MSVIYKYKAEIELRQELSIPKGAMFLNAQTQGRDMFLWFMVDPEAPKEPFVLFVYPTGHDIEEPDDELVHLATVQDDPFVWHLFELVQY